MSQGKISTSWNFVRSETFTSLINVRRLLQSRTRCVDTRVNFIHFSKHYQSYTSYNPQTIPKGFFSHPPPPGSMLILRTGGNLKKFDRNIEWGEGGCVNNFVRDCRSILYAFACVRVDSSPFSLWWDTTRSDIGLAPARRCCAKNSSLINWVTSFWKGS